MSEPSASVMQKDQTDKKPQEEANPSRRATRGKRDVETSENSYNIDEIRELTALFEDHGLTEFEFENENIRIRLSKNPAPPIIHAAHAPGPVHTPPGSSTTARGEVIAAPVAESAVEADVDLHKILSPIVGTFYRAPSPEKGPYVEIGSIVAPETVVCIVEAMKLMNEIQAETNGQVVKIYPENGQPVEYGQPLFGVKKN
jgi:acetyl-CoA carboxylase biotin carboxyl carrier protein